MDKIFMTDFFCVEFFTLALLTFFQNGEFEGIMIPLKDTMMFPNLISFLKSSPDREAKIGIFRITFHPFFPTNLSDADKNFLEHVKLGLYCNKNLILFPSTRTFPERQLFHRFQPVFLDPYDSNSIQRYEVAASSSRECPLKVDYDYLIDLELSFVLFLGYDYHERLIQEIQSFDNLYFPVFKYFLNVFQGNSDLVMELFCRILFLHGSRLNFQLQWSSFPNSLCPK